MKHIDKKGAPRDYQDWCKQVKGQTNEHYHRLQNPEKASLHGALIDEQGGLCAYTMRRISAASSHIEHIKPESVCRDDERGSDLDYKNLVACHPKEGMENPYRYGAQQKGSWWEDKGKDFVSPLHKQCENKFSFNLAGEIMAVGGNYAAQTTIDVLKLDHPSLTEDRKRAIQEFINGPYGDTPLRRREAEQAISDVCNLNRSGTFREYCVAIQHAVREYIDDLDKQAAKRKYAQQQRNKR